MLQWPDFDVDLVDRAITIDGEVVYDGPVYLARCEIDGKAVEAMAPANAEMTEIDARPLLAEALGDLAAA